jgi:hypothetical protein
MAKMSDYGEKWFRDGEPEPPPLHVIEDDDEPPPDVDDHHAGDYHADPTPAATMPAFADQLLSVSDFGRLPVVAPLVDGLLYRDTLAQLCGPPGSYKSFIAIGVCCALAAGRSNWEGHRIPRREHVVYVVAEGASGLHARILAWCERNNVNPADLDGWLHILPVAVQLGAVVHVDAALHMVNTVGAALLVLDTRARCTIGLEENSATEQGVAVEAADRIRAGADCTVWLIHHTGRNGQHPRGSTAWDGAVWSDLRLTADIATAAIKVEKHKDAPSGGTYDYRLLPHTVAPALMPGASEHARSTLVAFGSSGENSSENLTKILTQNENSVAKIAENSCGIEGLSRTKLVALSVEAGMSEATAYRAVNALVKRGALTNIGTTKQRRYIRSGLTLGGDDDNDA